MSQQILITGASSGGEPGQPDVAFRLDVHEFVKDEKQFSLYVQAIQRLYDSAENQDDSHFQIGGIHGLPYVQWNGAKLQGSGGYCEHGTTVFSTWHRPYCALYEQTLHRHAVDIAATYTSDREEWQKTAAKIRIPFWDWARRGSELPPPQFYDHRKYSQLTITHPDGSKGPVKNPLLGYRFKSGHGPEPPQDRFPPARYRELKVISQRPGTVRHPAADGTTNMESFETALRTAFEGIRSNIFRLLTYVSNWDDFSSQGASTGSGTSTASLENIHGTLHDRIGSRTGHMGHVPFAAFDPIFWLHHANVDRVLAVWQAIHYKSWIASGGPVDENTQLSPFWTEPTRFWTSAQCRVPMALKYNYADFEGLVSTDQEALSHAMLKRVRDLYLDEETFPGFPSLGRTVGAAARTAAQAPLGIAAASAPESIASNREGSDHHQHIEWTCRIRAKQKDLRDVCSILIFLGAVPPHSQGYDFSNDPGYAGSFDPFLNPFPDYCQNCLDGADTLLEGFVHMNYNLMQRGIDVNNVQAVEEYLRENLHWVPQMYSGEDARPEDLKTLEVTVIDTPLSGVGTWSHIPAPREVRKHNEITFDRPGGRVRVPGHA